MQKEKAIHIISFNIPYPPDYGGVIDIFYKIKNLCEAGYSIKLHAFQYNRNQSEELKQYCKAVYYYRRKTGLLSFFSYLPYIVYSRRAEDLLKNLLLDNYPILFEGLHSCYYLDHHSLRARMKFVRIHNIEHRYYKNLAGLTRKWTEKLFFLSESLKLKHYENVLNYADKIFAISLAESSYYSTKYGKTEWISAFHSNSEISSRSGKGNFILLHGNLMVRENEHAVIHLLKNILNFIDFQVIIAGKNPSGRLKSEIRSHPEIILIESPDDNELDRLISEAQVNLLISFQETGLKLKLINALFKGRFVIVNSKMVEGSGLNELVLIANDDKEMIDLINKNMHKEFDLQIIKKRKYHLNAYTNKVGIEKLDQFIQSFLDE